MYIRPIIEYGSLVLSNMPATLEDRLERLQRRACRICLRLPLFTPTHHTSILHAVDLPTLASRRKFRQLVSAHALINGEVPPHLRVADHFEQAQPSTTNLRYPRTCQVPVARTTRHRDSPINLALHHFNNLPIDLQNTHDADKFKALAGPLILSSICSCSAHPNPVKFL